MAAFDLQAAVNPQNCTPPCSPAGELRRRAFPCPTSTQHFWELSIRVKNCGEQTNRGSRANRQQQVPTKDIRTPDDWMLRLQLKSRLGAIQSPRPHTAL